MFLSELVKITQTTEGAYGAIEKYGFIISMEHANFLTSELKFASSGHYYSQINEVYFLDISSQVVYGLGRIEDVKTQKLIFQNKIKEMTIEEVEQELGYPIVII